MEGDGSPSNPIVLEGEPPPLYKLPDGGAEPMKLASDDEKEDDDDDDDDVEDDDEEDEDYFDEEDLDAGFGRVVRNLPDLALLKKGELGEDLRLIDYREALMSDDEESGEEEEGDDDDDDEDQENNEEDELDENQASSDAAQKHEEDVQPMDVEQDDIDGKEEEEEEKEEKEEEEEEAVDQKSGSAAAVTNEATTKAAVEDSLFAGGDLFQRGSPRRGGRPQMRNLIESLQAHTGQLAYGYDGTDDFIDDSDVFRLSMDSRSAPETPVAYSDFKVSAEWKPARGKVGGVSKMEGGALIPLHEFKPPLSDRVKRALKALHKLGVEYKWPSGDSSTRIPKHMEAASVEMGRAIMEWHPNGHLKVSVLRHLDDAFPFPAAKIKDKIKRLVSKSDSNSAATETTKKMEPVEEAKADDAEPGQTLKEIIAEKEEYLKELSDLIKPALEEQLEEMEKKKAEQKQESESDGQEGGSKRKARKVNTFFKWAPEARTVLLSLDLCVRSEHKARVALGEAVAGLHAFAATEYKDKVVAMFPEGFMDKSRLTYLVSVQKKKQKSK